MWCVCVCVCGVWYVWCVCGVVCVCGHAGGTEMKCLMECNLTVCTHMGRIKGVSFLNLSINGTTRIRCDQHYCVVLKIVCLAD